MKRYAGVSPLTSGSPSVKRSKCRANPVRRATYLSDSPQFKGQLLLVLDIMSDPNRKVPNRILPTLHLSEPQPENTEPLDQEGRRYSRHTCPPFDRIAIEHRIIEPCLSVISDLVW